MDGIEARIKGALLGLLAPPLVGVCAAAGAAAFAIVGSVPLGALGGADGATLGSAFGAAFGAALAGGFAAQVLAEGLGDPRSVRRVLAVLGLAAVTAAGTWMSPFVEPQDALLAAIAALFATAALTGAALLVPRVDEAPLRPRRWFEREGA